MAYLGTPPQSGFITTAKQRVTSSTNNYVDLDHAISSIADVIVFVNFVKQDTTNLTLTTSTRITLGGTLVSSDIVEIHYLGKAVNTQTPGTATVTNDMLAGSIANSKLANSSITLNGSAVSLGGSATVSSDTGTNLFKATMSSDQSSVTDNTWTKASFNTDVFDADNVFDTSNNRFVAPADGKYFLIGKLSIYPNTANGNQYWSRFYKNGSQASKEIVTAGLGGSDNYMTNFVLVSASVLDLSQNDYIEYYGRFNAPSGTITFDASESIFQGFRLV